MPFSAPGSNYNGPHNGGHFTQQEAGMSDSSEKPEWADKRDYPELGQEIGFTVDVKNVPGGMWVTDIAEPHWYGLDLLVAHATAAGITTPASLEVAVIDLEFDGSTFDPRHDDPGDRNMRSSNPRHFAFSDPKSARMFANLILAGADHLEIIQSMTPSDPPEISAEDNERHADAYRLNQAAELLRENGYVEAANGEWHPRGHLRPADDETLGD